MGKPVTLVDWNDERVAILRRMWTDGNSAAEIGKVIGASRNAVIGKSHRLKLESRKPDGPKISKTQSSAQAKKQAGAKSRTKAKAPRPTVAKHNPLTPPHDLLKPDNRALKSEAWRPLPGAEPIPLLKLTEHTCKWPIDDPVTGFCGHHTQDKPRGGSYSYCAEHQLRATRPNPIKPVVASGYKHSHIRIAPVKGIRA